MTDRNSDDQQIKVTDKRMFTPDGELREEFRDLDRKEATASEPTAGTPTTSTAGGPSAASPVVGPQGGSPAASSPSPSASPSAPSSSSPASPQDSQKKPAEAEDYPSGAQFEDLVGLLAQTTVTFLQQASNPQARTETLEQAQLYLDLLGILDDKTQGNLLPREKDMLQDALRQLRLAFAQRA